MVSEVESGLYLDALPDISVTIADKITPESDFDTETIFKKIEDRSIKKFRTLFINAVNKCHNVRDISICECLIESNYELFGTSLWYLMGAEFMYERSTSSRLNRFTTIDKSKAKDLRNDLMQLFSEELESIVNSIDVNDSDCTPYVIEENSIIQTHYAIP